MLVLVVGPSGAGKDSLLDAARLLLAGDPQFRFVRRAITRDAAAGGEDHEAVTQAEFNRRQADGGFALSWQAHGLCYGVPADIAATIAAGEVAIVNVSRAVIEPAARRFPTRVIEITASPDILAQRLVGRGRETTTDIAARLARAVLLPQNISVETIFNDGTRAAGTERFVEALNRAAESARRS
jgi:ribose 1,5-bisphosphokinase